MKYSYRISKELIEGTVYWVARCLEVDTIIGQGATQEEAIAELEENEATWLALAPEMGLAIPEPKIFTASQKYSGKLMLRISPNMHKVAAAHAKEQGISLNQYISDAIVYYNAYNDHLEGQHTFTPIESKSSSSTEYCNSSEAQIIVPDFNISSRKER